jgi:hypothetical protein
MDRRPGSQKTAVGNWGGLQKVHVEGMKGEQGCQPVSYRVASHKDSNGSVGKTIIKTVIG